MIDILPEQKEKMAQKNYGGSMRLGAHDANIKKGTIAYSAYKKKKIPKDTAIATKSILILSKNWKKKGLFFPANPAINALWKSLNCRKAFTPSLSALNSTQNSNPARLTRTRCF